MAIKKTLKTENALHLCLLTGLLVEFGIWARYAIV